MEKLAPYFWDGFKIGVLIALPFSIIRLIVYFSRKEDIGVFRFKRVFELLAICLAVTFSFVKDDDFKK